MSRLSGLRKDVCDGTVKHDSVRNICLYGVSMKMPESKIFSISNAIVGSNAECYADVALPI
jgi:hypothetical protein